MALVHVRRLFGEESSSGSDDAVDEELFSVPEPDAADKGRCRERVRPLGPLPPAGPVGRQLRFEPDFHKFFHIGIPTLPVL